MVFTITPTGEITKYIWEASDPVDLVIPKVINGITVTSIGDGAFFNCSHLKSLVIQEELISIGNAAFSGCYALKSVKIRKSLTSIGYGAFANCSALESLMIPKSLTSIGDYAFFDCPALQEILVGSDAEVKRIQHLLPERLRGLVKMSRCSELREMWITAAIFIGLSFNADFSATVSASDKASASAAEGSP